MITDLEQNSNKVRKSLIFNEDKSVMVGETTEVYFPQRFVKNGLAEVGDFVSIFPVLGIVLPNKCYSCFTSMLKMRMFPSQIEDVGINGDKYFKMIFEEGDTFFENLVSSVDPNVPYYYFMEFVNYAKIPWYMDWKHHSTLFDSAAAELGKKVGSSPQVMQVMYSVIYRDPDDNEKPYRGSKAMREGRAPTIVGLNNPSMLINDSFAKLMGGYLADNLLSSIIKPSDKVTSLDKMIRGIPTDEY